jgi:uncharacterized protein YfbU (UPF0304 family)
MSEELSSEESELVRNAIDVYEVMQRSYEEMDDRSGIDESRLRFPGFDGNNEGQYLAYANFLREKEDRFTHVRLGWDGMNSHQSLAGKYERMIREWMRVPSERRYANELTREEILSILDAGAAHRDTP